MSNNSATPDSSRKQFAVLHSGSSRSCDTRDRSIPEDTVPQKNRKLSARGLTPVDLTPELVGDIFMKYICDGLQLQDMPPHILCSLEAVQMLIVRQELDNSRSKEFKKKGYPNSDTMTMTLPDVVITVPPPDEDSASCCGDTELELAEKENTDREVRCGGETDLIGGDDTSRKSNALPDVPLVGYEITLDNRNVGPDGEIAPDVNVKEVRLAHLDIDSAQAPIDRVTECVGAPHPLATGCIDVCAGGNDDDDGDDDVGDDPNEVQITFLHMMRLMAGAHTRAKEYFLSSLAQITGLRLPLCVDSCPTSAFSLALKNVQWFYARLEALGDKLGSALLKPHMFNVMPRFVPTPSLVHVMSPTTPPPIMLSVDVVSTYLAIASGMSTYSSSEFLNIMTVAAGYVLTREFGVPLVIDDVQGRLSAEITHYTQIRHNEAKGKMNLARGYNAHQILVESLKTGYDKYCREQKETSSTKTYNPDIPVLYSLDLEAYTKVPLKRDIVTVECPPHVPTNNGSSEQTTASTATTAEASPDPETSPTKDPNTELKAYHFMLHCALMEQIGRLQREGQQALDDILAPLSCADLMRDFGEVWDMAPYREIIQRPADDQNMPIHDDCTSGGDDIIDDKLSVDGSLNEGDLTTRVVQLILGAIKLYKNRETFENAVVAQFCHGFTNTMTLQAVKKSAIATQISTVFETLTTKITECVEKWFMCVMCQDVDLLYTMITTTSMTYAIAGHFNTGAKYDDDQDLALHSVWHLTLDDYYRILQSEMLRKLCDPIMVQPAAASPANTDKQPPPAQNNDDPSTTSPDRVQMYQPGQEHLIQSAVTAKLMGVSQSVRDKYQSQMQLGASRDDLEIYCSDLNSVSCDWNETVEPFDASGACTRPDLTRSTLSQFGLDLGVEEFIAETCKRAEDSLKPPSKEVEVNGELCDCEAQVPQTIVDRPQCDGNDKTNASKEAEESITHSPIWKAIKELGGRDLVLLQHPLLFNVTMDMLFGCVLGEDSSALQFTKYLHDPIQNTFRVLLDKCHLTSSQTPQSRDHAPYAPSDILRCQQAIWESMLQSGMVHIPQECMVDYLRESLSGLHARIDNAMSKTTQEYPHKLGDSLSVWMANHDWTGALLIFLESVLQQTTSLSLKTNQDNNVTQLSPTTAESSHTIIANEKEPPNPIEETVQKQESTTTRGDDDDGYTIAPMLDVVTLQAVTRLGVTPEKWASIRTWLLHLKDIVSTHDALLRTHWSIPPDPAKTSALFGRTIEIIQKESTHPNVSCMLDRYNWIMALATEHQILNSSKRSEKETK